MPQNKKEVINKRRAEVSELYLKGYQQLEIAERVGVSQSQVSLDLKCCIKQWKEQQLNNIDEIKSLELEKINKLEVTYWGAWELSQESQMKKRAKKFKGELKEQILEEISNVGDPRYLQGVQWCINKRCEILGVNAAKKMDFQNSDGSLAALKIPEKEIQRINDSLENNY